MRFYNRTIVLYQTKYTRFFTPSIKITSGEISADEQQGRTQAKYGLSK